MFFRTCRDIMVGPRSVTLLRGERPGEGNTTVLFLRTLFNMFWYGP